MTGCASHAFKRLNGLFAVYKPPGKTVFQLKTQLNVKIMKDLNSMKQIETPKKVVFEKQKSQQSAAKKLKMVPLEERVVLKEDWFYHPAVQGPAYKLDDVLIYSYDDLDEFCSGVQVCGIGPFGKILIRLLDQFNSTCCYDVFGEFGKATSTCDDDGKIVDKSTYDHIHKASINHALNMMVGRNRPSQIEAAQMDLSTQYAYEMASKGFLRSSMETGPILYDGNLVEMAKPHFRIEVICLNGHTNQLKSLIHELGLELMTTSTCTKIRRKRQFIFEAMSPSTMIPTELTTEDICRNIEKHDHAVKEILGNRAPHLLTLPSENTDLSDGNYTMQLI